MQQTMGKKHTYIEIELTKRWLLLKKKKTQSTEYVKSHWSPSYNLLDHDGDILIQIAAVVLDQIHQNMEKVRGKPYVHPQEDEARWERGDRDLVSDCGNEQWRSESLVLMCYVRRCETKTVNALNVKNSW